MKHCAASVDNIDTHVYIGRVDCDTVAVDFRGFFNFPGKYDLDSGCAGDEAFLKASGPLFVEDDGHD